ncbi:fumble-domain-containing protein [Microdochium trichocladiopsis]|uniref:Fumble-domain-containing protein n=1 Tax=Microdochium trichocladiopsis TaxID=1682393 RepID=A0A9P8YD42_9PEZI|nr:fumble-domain-containing protein [Microdochium trichocladiopsis]KAH7037128.1 fumble-domain-containing protein [Microdochium trichocladiopsis]
MAQPVPRDEAYQAEAASADRADDIATPPAAATAAIRRPRTATNTAEIDSTIHHPGSVRINVKGAFIVDGNEPGTPAATTSTSATPSILGDSPGLPAHHLGSNGSSGFHETKDIRLPNHTAVVSHIAVDIGGSLAKLVYFSREAHSREPGGRLNFLSFETDHIDDCIEFMHHLKDKQLALNGSAPSDLCVMATGGGSYKYYDRIRKRLGIDVHREEEMECLIIGLDFFITEIPREVFTYSETDPMHFAEPDENIYPYMLVNIGSGVSILKVSGPRTYERVGGTSLGGGTLWGLLSLLTGAENFDEMLDMAAHGDNTKVDMLVGDIYGTDYGKIGLKTTTIASSFGKVFRMKREAGNDAEDSGGYTDRDETQNTSRQETQTPQETPPSQTSSHPQPAATSQDWAYPSPTPAPAPASLQPPAAASTTTSTTDTQEWAYPSPAPPLKSSTAGADQQPDDGSGKRFSSADISRSLLFAISNNIGQIAYLQSRVHNLNHIYFGGSFIRGHPQTMNTLSYAIKFWSKGSKQAYFLRHEGYLGAVGAFLKRQPRNWGRRGSFEEGGGQAGGLEARMRGRTDATGGGDSASSSGAAAAAAAAASSSSSGGVTAGGAAAGANVEEAVE